MKCTECKFEFTTRAMAEGGRGMCSACFRRTTRDRIRAAMAVTVEGDTVRIQLPAELHAWVRERAEHLRLSEEEFIKTELLGAMGRLRPGESL